MRTRTCAGRSGRSGRLSLRLRCCRGRSPTSSRSRRTRTATRCPRQVIPKSASLLRAPESARAYSFCCRILRTDVDAVEQNGVQLGAVRVSVEPCADSLRLGKVGGPELLEQ